MEIRINQKRECEIVLALDPHTLELISTALQHYLSIPGNSNDYNASNHWDIAPLYKQLQRAAEIVEQQNKTIKELL